MASDLLYKPIATLHSETIPFTALNKKWKCKNKQYPEAIIEKFIKLNEPAFRFLGIQAHGIFVDGKYALQLTTSNYVGCIPTLSPENGKPAGDIIVTGRFKEDILELLSVTGESILPEFNENLRLSSGDISKPPLHYECANYIDHYIKAQKSNWRKFNNQLDIKNHPDGSTLWEKYAMNTDPTQAFKYPNKNNRLILNHPEWEELTYVLHLAIGELESIRTPYRSKIAYLEKINRLKTTYSHDKLKKISKTKIHMSDPTIIKELKSLANIILGDISDNRTAWRLDFATFFERYVQCIIERVAKLKGAKEHCNKHFNIYGDSKPQWCLNYLEPDIIIQHGECQYIVDAKYKSHMFNFRSNTEELRESFRHDLHQILAYTSLNQMQVKQAILIYPSGKFHNATITLRNPLNGTRSNVQIVGIPLIKAEVNNIVQNLQNIITF